MNDLQHTSEAFFAAQKDGPDAIAVRKQEVKLTKFQSLPSDCQRQIYLDIEMQRPDQQKTVANSPLQVQVTSGEWPMTNPQSFLRHTSGANSIGNSNKWPWSAKTKISLEPTINSTTCESTTTTNINNNNNNSALVTLQQSREPFQVVWRRLSFEAPINTYDQLIVKALKGFRSLLPFQASRRHSVNNKDVGHCYPQTPSVHFEPTEDLRNSSHQLGSQKRLIFENLNGYVNSGEISAILGPSGAGKTSLLNAICGRVDNFRGSVQLIGGGKRRMRLSVIPQKDYLIENLTVRENLLYSSRILIIEKDFDHEANIMRVVRMLNLTSCFTSCVSNISGGEYKRVSIAQELLRQPDILILDEPTSGLDSLTCKKLIKSLTKLIEASILGTIQPIAIMMTIHQPDVEVFQMFDHVYCMGRRGRVIYDGHPSHTLDVIRSQSNLPAHMFPDPKESGRTINPANLLIEIASEELYGSEPVERLARYQRKQFELLSTVPVTSSTTIAATSHTVPSPIPGTELVLADERASPESGHHNHLYKAPLAIGSLFSAYHKSNSSLASAGSNMSPSHTHRSNSTSSLSSSMKPAKVDHLVRDKRLSSKSNHSGHLWHHTNILARRAFTASIRDPLMTMVSLIFHLSIPFVMWTVYPRQVGTVSACPMIQHEFDMVSMVSNNSLNKMADLQHQLIFAMECGTMFFITCYAFSMCSLAVSALAFPMNMHVLLKEVRNGWYSLPCYVVAKTIANFPFEVIFPVMSLVMIYLLLGMPESHMHWRLLAIALVMALIAMISHTNGFIFGALFMDSVQSAIFLSISSTLPLILLSGYTSRIKFMPQILQNLSWLSPYRYSSEAISIVRFGYGICPCDESTDEYLKNTAPTFADIPGQIRPLFSYYLANSGSGTPATTTTEEIVSTTLATTSLAENITAAIPTIANDTLTAIVNSTRPLIAKMIPGVTRELVLEGDARSEMLRKIESNEIDVFSHMADLMARSFSFGRHIESCKSVRSELLSTLGIPDDSHLQWAFGGLLVLLVVTKTMLFIAVKYKIGSRI